MKHPTRITVLALLLTLLTWVGAAGAQTTPSAYMTFAVNTHDWIRGDESAALLTRLIDLFEANGVRGDFYLTAPIAEHYAVHHPALVEKLCSSEMTISYHVRPPHPLNQGFDASLRNLSGQALYDAIYAAETQKLDLATGELIPDELGGYLYVAQLCGRNPVALGVPHADQQIRETAMAVYAELGAQMVIQAHETGAELFQLNGLWTRPSDFSITRWQSDGLPEEAFWWDMLDGDMSAAYEPIPYLQAQLANWTASQDRPAFVTALIHEQNFYWQDGSPWDGIYFAVTGETERRPLRPPFDLNAEPPAGEWRTEANQTLIWEHYAALVSYAATQPDIAVVTSEDIVAMAGQR